MNAPAAPWVDTRQVRRAADAAAASYPAAAVIAREIGQRMLERLEFVNLTPSRVLDLGCGTGDDLPLLAGRFPEAQLLAADLSPLRATQARQHLPAATPSSLQRWLPRLNDWLGAANVPAHGALAANAAALPLAGASCGLLWSNLMLHWCGDPLAVLRESFRVLEVGGLLMFAVPGPDTFRELRRAFTDAGLPGSHHQRFIDLHDWGDMLVGCGFADPVMDMEMLTITYPDFAALLAELRALGSTNAMHDRPKGLLGRAGWQRLQTAVADLAAKQADGRLPVTLEVVYGHAWKTTAVPPSPKTADGRSVIHLDRSRLKK